jgi:hypothetical protein
MSIYNDDRTPVKIIWAILSTDSIEKITIHSHCGLFILKKKRPR